MDFLQRFDSEWGPRLGPRRDTFRATFEFLIRKGSSPPLIVETGCAREADDSFHQLRGFRTAGGNFVLLEDQGIAGKAKYVAEYFDSIGVRPLFDGYQCGWVVS